MISWISINDRLPQEGQEVLIYMRGNISLRLFENNAFHNLENDYYTALYMKDGVTHWAVIEAPEVN